MVEKFPVYHHFFTTTNLSLISKKRAKSNYFFARQCSFIDNGNALPSLFHLITDKSLLDVHFSVEDIKNIINKLDSNKVHGDDMISIRMLKLCDKSICKPCLQFLSVARHFLNRMEKRKCRTNSQKKTTSSVLKTTDLPLFSQSLAKF